MTRYRPCHPLVLLLALLGVATVGGAAAAGSARPADQADAVGAAPVLTGAVVTALAPGTVRVTGEGFTPDGLVYVALHVRGDAAPREARWTAASRAAYGPNGSADPALGFRPGGTLSETVPAPCGAEAAARALDGRTARWSNWLDIDLASARPARYAPNGSTDPARGYRSGC